MRLKEALSLPWEGGTVCLVGGGGKTSLMLALARELAGDGPGVLITTTTHMMAPGPQACDILLTDCRADTLTEALARYPIVCAASPSPEGKLSSLPRPLLEAAASRARWLIVEADGARRLPVKAAADHEPQIFEPSDAVVAVAGLSAWEKPLGEIGPGPLWPVRFWAYSRHLLTPRLPWPSSHHLGTGSVQAGWKTRAGSGAAQSGGRRPSRPRWVRKPPLHILGFPSGAGWQWGPCGRPVGKRGV